VRRALLCAALALGCRDDEVAFAVQQGYLTAGEAPSGYWVWTFFPAAWERDNDPERLLCSRVQRIRGARIDPASLSGCPDCTDAFALELEELEHDCRGQEGSRPDLAGPLWVAFGPGAKGQAGPYPAASLAFSSSWDGQRWATAGTAFDEALLEGDPPEGDPAWTPEQRLALWPSEALAL